MDRRTRNDCKPCLSIPVRKKDPPLAYDGSIILNISPPDYSEISAEIVGRLKSQESLLATILTFINEEDLRKSTAYLSEYLELRERDEMFRGDSGLEVSNENLGFDRYVNSLSELEYQTLKKSLYSFIESFLDNPR